MNSVYLVSISVSLVSIVATYPIIAKALKEYRQFKRNRSPSERAFSDHNDYKTTIKWRPPTSTHRPPRRKMRGRRRSRARRSARITRHTSVRVGGNQLFLTTTLVTVLGSLVILGITLSEERANGEQQRAEALVSRASAQLEEGQFDRALEDYKLAIALNPHSAAAYDGRGTTYRKRGEFERAILDYNHAIELCPACAQVYVNRGLAYYSTRRLDRAILDFDRAIQIQPDLVSAYESRATALSEIGEYRRAIIDLNRAAELNPFSPTLYLNRGIAYKQAQDVVRAKDDFHTAIRLSGDDATLIRAAREQLNSL
jgi:tetratricopeptide (TPR) repeat protein